MNRNQKIVLISTVAIVAALPTVALLKAVKDRVKKTTTEKDEQTTNEAR
jgi:hypothetical protein